MAEKIWDQLKKRYSQARSDNPMHLPTGSANPKKTDWIIVEQLSFLREYVSNRPVVSSLSQNSSKSPCTSQHFSSFAGMNNEIIEEQLHHRQPKTAVKSALRSELTSHARGLPAVHPELDQMGRRNKERREGLLSQAEEFQECFLAVQESVKNHIDNPDGQVFTSLLCDELNLVVPGERQMVYQEVTSALRNLEEIVKDQCTTKR